MTSDCSKELFYDFKANFLKLSETIFHKYRFLRHTSGIIFIQLLKTPLNGY